jgi:hypothetical protein
MMWARTARGQAVLAKLQRQLSSYRRAADASFQGRDIYKEMRAIVTTVIRDELPHFSFEDDEVEVTPILSDEGKESFDIRFPIGMQHAVRVPA